MKKETLNEFKASMVAENAPGHLSVYGKSLWWAGKGNWEKSHDLIQNLNDQTAARIHAYLHRLEGDISNAKYWYSRANSELPADNLNQEWEYLVNQNLL